MHNYFTRSFSPVFLYGQIIVAIVAGLWGGAAWADAATPATSQRLGVAFGAKYAGQSFIPLIDELGISLAEVHITWQQIEPVKGHYRWDVLDALLDQLVDSRVQVLIGVSCKSNWATKVPSTPGGSPPLVQEDYYNFVYQLVKHSQGRIVWWMNDWEPETSVFWNGTPEEYLTTLKTFTRAVKSANPRAQVVLGGHSGIFTQPPENRGLKTTDKLQASPDIAQAAPAVKLPKSKKDSSPGRRSADARQKLAVTGFKLSGISGIKEPRNREFYDYVLERGRDYFDYFDLRLYGDIYDIPDRVKWFRERMQSLGYQKPFFSTEYGGPIPTQFAESAAYLKQAAELQKPSRSGANMQSTNRHLYVHMAELPPQVRMFLVGCSRELDAKRDRLQARDMASRTVMALSCGVEKLWLWDLYNIRNNILTGKLGLMEDPALSKRSAAFYNYQRLAQYLNGVVAVERLAAREENVFLFRARKNIGKDMYIIWERRDPFNGEDLPPRRYKLKIWADRAEVKDVFGQESTSPANGGSLTLDISDTPLFIFPFDSREQGTGIPENSK